MKSLTTSIAAFACLSFMQLSCEKQPLKIDKENLFNISFKSTINEHVVLQNSESRILVNIKNISDNRCPNHLNCSDPGDATVRIEVSNFGNSKAETLLHLGSINGETKNTDSVTVQLDNRSYVFYLHSVNPHPMLAATENQTAEVCVKPKQ